MVKVTGGERVGRSLALGDIPMHFSEMAARAGIEPGQAILPSSDFSVLADSYGSQGAAASRGEGVSNGELFTGYVPPQLAVSAASLQSKAS